MAANFILLFNENYLINERHSALEALLDKFIGTLKAQEIKVPAGPPATGCERADNPLRHGREASAIFPRRRSEVRHAAPN